MDAQTSGGRAKGTAASASAHFTSDSGSRKTAFAVAMRSGVTSTPESRETCTAGSRSADAAFGHNMASSIRHGVSEGAAMGTGASGQEEEAGMSPSAGERKRDLPRQPCAPASSAHLRVCSPHRRPYS